LEQFGLYSGLEKWLIPQKEARISSVLHCSEGEKMEGDRVAFIAMKLGAKQTTTHLMQECWGPPASSRDIKKA
jgi:hypothetical protein